jgi:ribosomal protein L32
MTGRPRRLARSPRAAMPAVSACPDCGKVRYPSRRAAKQVAMRVYQDRRMRAYQCGGFFHLTSGTAAAAAWHRESAAGG